MKWISGTIGITQLELLISGGSRPPKGTYLFGVYTQWLKWFLTKPGWSKPHTHSNPTNLALFRHKITLYRFNKGGSYYCRGGSNGSRGLSPPGPLTLTSEYTLPSVSLVCRKFFPVGCAEDTVNSAVHASACYACRARYYFSNNVCLSVCPSSAGIVSKRTDISTHFLTFW